MTAVFVDVVLILQLLEPVFSVCHITAENLALQAYVPLCNEYSMLTLTEC